MDTLPHNTGYNYRPPEPTAEEQYNKDVYRSLTMEASVSLKAWKEVKGMLLEFGVPLESPVIRICWGYLTDESVKTTIDDKQFKLLMMEWRAYKCKVIDQLASLGTEVYLKHRLDIDNVGRVIEVRGRRALNGFERKMIVTSSSESVSSANTVFSENQPKRGLIRRALGI
jgi:hypothetical protein